MLRGPSSGLRCAGTRKPGPQNRQRLEQNPEFFLHVLRPIVFLTQHQPVTATFTHNCREGLRVRGGESSSSHQELGQKLSLVGVLRWSTEPNTIGPTQGAGVQRLNSLAPKSHPEARNREHRSNPSLESARECEAEGLFFEPANRRHASSSTA